MPFENFDFSDFWDDCEWAKKAYINEPPTDELISEIEAELGYKLPESYIWLMKRHNGGVPVKNTFYYGDNEYEYAEIDGILGIGRCKSSQSPCFYITDGIADEWGYPNIGVAICECPSAGHDMIFLDYRKCGPQGEPQVVHIDQEGDYCITFLANNFEEFIRGLEENRDFAAEKAAELKRLRGAEFSPLLSELCERCDDPAATERWIRTIAEKIVERSGVFKLYLEEDSLLYDIQFLLYTNAYPNTTEMQYLADYEKILALGISFDVDENKPAFIKNWRKKQKESGFIVRKYDKRNNFTSVEMTDKAKKKFNTVFSAQGYCPELVENWLNKRKNEGIIAEHDGVISMTDEAKKALLEKRKLNLMELK